MQSKIAEALRCAHQPVALLFSDEKPERALQFAEGRWGCVMWLFAAAAKGRPAVADAATFGCIGGGVGLGFGNQYESWPGGVDCFHRFLSTGVEGWERGQEVAEASRPFLRDEAFEELLHGERYVKSPELVEKFVEAMPFMDAPKRYVVLRPLSSLDEGESPELVVFTVNPDQLSALVVLANYDREGTDSVVIPFAAGCQTLGIIPLAEGRREPPRAVVGLTDLSARVHINKRLGPNLMTFAVSYQMFEQMEGNVEGSFLERPLWRSIVGVEE